ncbi:methionyl-tRNA synthetase [Aphelenchoides avenae]|nr:methionyl-tRNA synthetase [Aphelenchus avenae]
MLLARQFVACAQRRHKCFVTTPIFYVNSDPHIGHLYSALLADAAHRWELLKSGRDPRKYYEDFTFATGTDEHGIKVQLAAGFAKKLPREHCDYYSSRFRNMFEKFQICHTDFIRTSEERHKQSVQHFWKVLKEKGHIQKDVYEGWYSAVDECFYAPAEVEELTDDKGQKRMVAKETKAAVEWIQEENYMFDLSPFQGQIRQWLNASGMLFHIAHPMRKAGYMPIALSYIREDHKLSISRDSKRLKWGIPVPDDPSQTIYVWLDALTNYLSVANYPNLSANWPPDLQILGKDILKFHAIYWPSFLLAAGLPLPKKLFVHGHWLVDGVKMSKSIGNVVDPFKTSEELSVDGLRYFLLKQGIPNDDSNYTTLKAINVINADLVNNLGNLVNRGTVKKLNPKQKYPSFDVEVMEHELKGTGEKLVLELKALPEKVAAHYDNMLFYKGLELIANAGRNANAFFQLHEPWKLSQGPKLSTVLYLTYETARICNVLLQPIVPSYADRVLSRFGLNESERELRTTRFMGGPELKMFGRPLGEDTGSVLERIKCAQMDEAP